METIKNYLDNMFANLPKTDEVLKLKNDLLSNMEDKYNELKSIGKSENEAIGIVISEFGNIDELISELGIQHNNEEVVLPTLSEEEVDSFMETEKRSGKLVGIGVVLCILGGAFLILFNQLIEDGFINVLQGDAGDALGLIPLLLLVAIAVGLFIYSSSIVEKYKYLEDGFDLPTDLNATIQQGYDSFKPRYDRSVIIGVILCILSPVALFLSFIFGESASVYGFVILIFIVAIAVYIFIYFGSVKDSYAKLLKIDEFSYSKKEPKAVKAVAAIVWPIAVCIFLVSGLVYNKWHINWIVFPITGILFGMFSTAYKIIKGDKKVDL